MSEKPGDPAGTNEDEIIPLAAGEPELEALPEETVQDSGEVDAGEGITIVGDPPGLTEVVVEGDLDDAIELPAAIDATGAPVDERPVDIIADEEQLASTSSVPVTERDPAGETMTLPESDSGPAPESEGSGWRSRLGSVFGKGSEEGTIDPGSPGDVEEGPERPAAAASTMMGIRGFFDPGMNGIDTRFLRYASGIAALVVFGLLLANQAGAALILASAVVPVLAVMLLTAHDVYERESNLLLVGVGAAGAVSGLVLGGIASWVTRGQWIDTGRLNFGAGGFGGQFAPGAAPFLVWLVVGILLPAAMVAGLAAAPLLLRRWPQFANEVMDGMILAGASAAGLSIGLAAVFWWPMVVGDGPLMDVRDWTLSIVGQALLRPLVITLSGALIGAGVWRYMLNPNGSLLLLAPSAAGVLGLMMLWIGSLALQPGGIWPEFLLVLCLAVLVFAAYRRTLDLAVAADRAAVGDAGERLVCPTCHQVTPVGAFCARCGSPLPGQ